MNWHLYYWGPHGLIDLIIAPKRGSEVVWSCLKPIDGNFQEMDETESLIVTILRFSLYITLKCQDQLKKKWWKRLYFVGVLMMVWSNKPLMTGLRVLYAMFYWGYFSEILIRDWCCLEWGLFRWRKELLLIKSNGSQADLDGGFRNGFVFQWWSLPFASLFDLLWRVNSWPWDSNQWAWRMRGNDTLQHCNLGNSSLCVGHTLLD